MARARLADGSTTTVPALPIEFEDVRPRTRLDLPALGEHTGALLQELGYSEARINALRISGGVRGADAPDAART